MVQLKKGVIPRELCADLDYARLANVSDCGVYRYTLARQVTTLGWDPLAGSLGRILLFICLNPSVADVERWDPTLRRCFGYGRDLGYDRVELGNLTPYRATKPEVLDTVDDATLDSPLGHGALWGLVNRATTVVAAWGNHRVARRRAAPVLEMLAKHQVDVYALAVTDDGYPRHPLYLKKTLRPQLLSSFEGRAA